MTKDEKDQGNLWSDLVASGKFERALASMDRAIKQNSQDSLLYRERAHLHLYLGHAQQARSDFDATARLEAEEFRIPPGRLQSNLEHDAVGVTYWMEQHKELATAFWRYTTRMLAMNRVSYAHMGGGIESGLLLWFGAVHERNADDIELVRRFYELRLAGSFSLHDLTGWPGPLVRFFLNQCDEQALIEAVSGGDARTQLCKAHFALALRAREKGRHRVYWKHLELAAPERGGQALYDFYNVLPYFLARSELARRSK